MGYRTFVFDMDGTLLNTAPGIIESMRLMQKELGMPEYADEKEYYRFIGPPLYPAFQQYWGMTQEEAQRALDIFRRSYADTGIYNSRVYDGVFPMLEDIRSRGGKIAIATMKVEKFARIATDHFDLTSRIDCLYGYDDDRSPTKADLIRGALAHMGETDSAKVLMIGDSMYDCEGAKEAGVDFAAVHFDNPSALANRDVVLIASSMAEVHRFILAHIEA